MSDDSADTPSADELRSQRRARVLHRAREQAGVISRRALYDAGMTRSEVRAQVRARRWQRVGTHCLVLHTGPLTTGARCWVAVIEGGPRAYVDGASALVLAGLTGFEPDLIRITVPRGARIRHRPSPSIDIRQTRRWDPADVVADSAPARARPAVAAVRAALWARSDRQALLVLTMTVQQQIADVSALAREMLRIRRDRRRTMIHDALIDLAGGIGSLAELDVLRGCRERGLPEPDLQVVRKTPDGSYFLDFRWSRWRTVLEVDGIQHTWAQHLVGDALRHNSIALEGDVVLRMPVLGLRLCPDDFFDQVNRALRRAGWVDGDLLRPA